MFESIVKINVQYHDALCNLARGMFDVKRRIEHPVSPAAKLLDQKELELLLRRHKQLEMQRIRYYHGRLCELYDDLDRTLREIDTTQPQEYRNYLLGSRDQITAEIRELEAIKLPKIDEI